MNSSGNPRLTGIDLPLGKGTTASGPFSPTRLSPWVTPPKAIFGSCMPADANNASLACSGVIVAGPSGFPPTPA